MSGMNRTKKISIRLTPREYEVLQLVSENDGLNESTFARVAVVHAAMKALQKQAAYQHKLRLRDALGE